MVLIIEIIKKVWFKSFVCQSNMDVEFPLSKGTPRAGR